MSVLGKKTVLSDLSVRDTMRMQVIKLPRSASIEKGIRFLIKYKINALLLTEENDSAAGVVSKADIMAAYYAELPIESPLRDIMIGPALCCNPGDSVESALEIMRSNGVYRLYVVAGSPQKVVGVLAYPDIVGTLYRYCFGCENSLLNRRKNGRDYKAVPRFKVQDVMTSSVTSFSESNTLLEIMEGLSSHRLGAVLIVDGRNAPIGVISKTDLILAYKRGVPSASTADTVLTSSPVRSCGETEFIEEAIRKMIFSEVQRLFVHKRAPQNIVGVFSLSDAARIRSGSCRACESSRIRI